MNLTAIILSLRQFRTLHRWTGLTLSLIVLVMSITGILLAWKKEVELLQPPTQKGKSTQLAEWKTVEEVARTAMKAIDSVTQEKNEIDRMDVRPDKGIIKVLFKKKSWEVQVDATTGKVLSAGKRHADWIEKVHDGSIITDTFKVIYSTIAGLGLLLLTFTGLWLWYGPRVVRKSKHS
jgi:uncharacterized iron-regulated membrane protein